MVRRRTASVSAFGFALRGLAGATGLLLLFLLAAAGGTRAGAQETLDDIDKGKSMDSPAPAPEEPAKSTGNVAGNPPGNPTGNPTGSPTGNPSGQTPEPLKLGSTEGKAVADVNGYLDNRFNFGWVHTGGLAPTKDIPTLSDLLEANIQLKVSIGQKAFVYTDISLFLQGGGLYYDQDASGNRYEVPSHDVPSLRPLIVPAELYASYTPKPYLSLLLGKKRITWGSGFAFNPSDLLNPPKDPTDPTFQRAGAWLLRVEAPFKRFTLSAVFSPTVLYQQSGLPYSVLYYPGYPSAESLAAPAGTLSPPLSGEAHYLAAARLYALLWNSDINLIYYFSNRYRGDDDFQNKSRVALSFSRYFFTDWELHVEALLQLGTTRRYADHDVALGGTPQFQPNQSLFSTLFPQTNINATTFYPRLVVGTRRTFSDESNLSIEYYLQTDGYTPDQFQDYVRLLSRAQSLGLLGSFGLSGSQTATQSGLPQKFSFDPLRRHYLIASYAKPKIFNDFTASLTLIAGLEDLSGIITPSVSWNAKEWLLLTLAGYIPFHGIPVGTVCAALSSPDGSCPSGQAQSEYSLFPQDFRVLFQVRAFY